MQIEKAAAQGTRVSSTLNDNAASQRGAQTKFEFEGFWVCPKKRSRFPNASRDSCSLGSPCAYYSFLF